MIEHVESHVIFENPKPMLRSRHGFFPGVVELLSGELLALLVIGEAFESVDLTTHVARSADGGRTWQLQGPVHERTDRTARRATSSSRRSCATARSLRSATASTATTRNSRSLSRRPTASCPVTTS